MFMRAVFANTLAPFLNFRERSARDRAKVRFASGESLTQAKRLDKNAVALDVDLAQVRLEATATTDHLEQTTVGVVVVLVVLEVALEAVDACGEQRDLDLGGAGVTFAASELLDDFFLLVGMQRHLLSLFEPLQQFILHTQNNRCLRCVLSGVCPEEVEHPRLTPLMSVDEGGGL